MCKKLKKKVNYLKDLTILNLNGNYINVNYIKVNNNPTFLQVNFFKRKEENCRFNLIFYLHLSE